MLTIEEHFQHLHENPPAPFNSHYNPLASQYASEVSAEMESEGFYDSHSKEECAIEFRKRIDAKIK